MAGNLLICIFVYAKGFENMDTDDVGGAAYRLH